MSKINNTGIFSLVVALCEAGASLLIALTIAICSYFLWYKPEATQREQDILTCKAPAPVGDRYADPVTGTCGVQQKRVGAPGEIIMYAGNREACWEILQDKRFAPVWHCWKKILAPKNP